MANQTRSPQLQALFHHGTTRRYDSGQLLGSTDQDNPLRLVVDGYIKRYMIRDDGSMGIQIIYGPQDVFSLTKIYNSVLGQSIYEGNETYYYSAITNTTVMTIDIETLVQVVATEPLVYKELFSEAGRHLKNCIHSLENIQTCGTPNCLFTS
jgi:CRP-like cAMP-binding protein